MILEVLDLCRYPTRDTTKQKPSKSNKMVYNPMLKTNELNNKHNMIIKHTNVYGKETIFALKYK